LVEHPEDTTPQAVPPFEINAPGRIVRKRRSAVLPASQYAAVRPIKLGHVVLYTPDVMASLKFATEGLGMGLADQVSGLAAFVCARKDSDHHVVAFGKSTGIGFHHASFQVKDPDEVGRGGNALLAKAGRGDWGFGRHTIGSNYFHYIQDPWGSWFEYYADMDYIDDYTLWNPSDYAPEDSLSSWGPQLPSDFGHNYEVEEKFAS
jgi:catechol 2,3-dioxygenase